MLEHFVNTMINEQHRHIASSHPWTIYPESCYSFTSMDNISGVWLQLLHIHGPYIRSLAITSSHPWTLYQEYSFFTSMYHLSRVWQQLFYIHGKHTWSLTIASSHHDPWKTLPGLAEASSYQWTLGPESLLQLWGQSLCYSFNACLFLRIRTKNLSIYDCRSKNKPLKLKSKYIQIRTLAV